MRAAAFVIAALFLPAAVAAQEPPIKVGEGVRFWTTQSRIATYGTLTRWEADSFAIAGNWIPITSVSMLEVHRGQKTSASTVALYTAIGAGSGAVVTAGLVLTGCLLARLVELGCGGPDEELVEGVTPLGFIGIGAGVGALVGALIGATRKTDRWETVPLDRIRVSLTPRGGGLEVSAKFVF